MSVVDPAANQVEEVHGNGKVKALFPSTDEKPQTEGTVTAMRLSAVLIHLVLNPCDHNLVQTEGKLHLSSYRYKTKKRELSYHVREFKMNAIMESLPCMVAKPRTCKIK